MALRELLDLRLLRGNVVFEVYKYDCSGLCDCVFVKTLLRKQGTIITIDEVPEGFLNYRVEQVCSGNNKLCVILTMED